jgi:hypothetical protein
MRTPWSTRDLQSLVAGSTRLADRISMNSHTRGVKVLTPICRFACGGKTETHRELGSYETP